jgi:predicted NUDIX family phosphoesterase
MQQVKVEKASSLKKDEKILVVPRAIIFESKQFDGFLATKDLESYQKTIELHKEFLWRSEVENNTSYKQIIPYLVFEFNEKIFIMQRKSTASESRLQSKYSLGIGGHIREEDIENKSLNEWAMREFDEEVNYQGQFSIKPLGLINDDSNEVGQVHLGFVFLLQGNSDKISIRDEHKSGKLCSFEECESFFPSMETWSQLVFEYMKKHKDF